MKLLAAILLMVSANVAFAEDDRYLENNSIIDLASVNGERVIQVSYPGLRISGVCHIEIVADSWGRVKPIARLMDALEIKSLFSPGGDRAYTVISDMTVRIQLAPTGAYTDGVIIRTKDGSSIEDTIVRTLGSRRRVVVLPRSC